MIDALIKIFIAVGLVCVTLILIGVTVFFLIWDDSVNYRWYQARWQMVV